MTIAPILFDDPMTLLTLARDLERINRGDGPKSHELLAAPALIDWHLHWCRVPCLIGIGVGHPLVKDGPMVTSRLIAIDPEGRWARTNSRYYTLAPSQKVLADG